MEAGRELDALIAEKVMGYTVRVAEGPYELSPYGLHPGDLYVGHGEAILPYSTDIAAAWEVVEKGLIESVVKLKDGRWFARPAQQDFSFESKPGDLACGFDMEMSGGYYEIPIYYEDTNGAIADSAPLAICLAALKTIQD